MGKPAGKDSAKNARTAANRERRIKREERRQRADFVLRPKRAELRARGALNRIQRRIRTALSRGESASRLLLVADKVAAAYARRQQGAS